MGLGNTVKAIWSLLNGTTNPNITLLTNYLYQNLEGAKLYAPQGMGNIYFVDGGTDGVTVGDNANNGKTPATAFLTIAYAITQCTNNNNDYIFCFNVYAQEVFPITINLDCLHIIGLDAPDGNYLTLDAANSLGGAVDDAVFIIGGLGQNCEIAGFMLSGGATHPAIEITSGANQLWIHNCTFGHYWCGAGQDGIGGGGSVFNVVIEDCWFYGTDAKNGTLTRCGIISGVGASWGQWTIRNNFFNGLPTRAIDLGVTLASTALHDFAIDRNIIGCEDTDNIAIGLGTMCHYAMVSDNKAQSGKDEMANNPFHDLATDNHWMCNQEGIVIVYPDT